MSSGAGDTTQLVPGYPIRTPWDHSSVDSSPRPIAASHVLHRLLVPRHPPSALDNLTTKMLASTVQFSTNNQPTTHQPHTPPPGAVCSPGHAWHTHPEETHPARRRQPPNREAHATATRRCGCFFRTQQGAHRHHPAAPTPRSTTPTPTGAGHAY
jgi:hypothetical protein